MSIPALAASHQDAGNIDVIRSPAGQAQASLTEHTFASHSQGSQIYKRAAAKMLPQWLRILTPSPWSLALKKRRVPDISCQDQQLRLAASWAVVKLAEADMDDANIATFSELARATLIHWQLSLLDDGRPRRIADRKSDAVFPAAWYVVRMLEDTAVGTTPMLLNDLAKHLRWLATRSPNSSWSPVTAIGAIAGGGVLLRDNSLVTLARKRLTSVIDSQTSEGWFPEFSRFDVIKQAQTISVLGQLYYAYNWTALQAPLRRAVDFFAGVVANEANVLAPCPPMPAAFLFPQGFELLADEMPAALKMTNGCRSLASTMAESASQVISDELAAIAGGDMLCTPPVKPIDNLICDVQSKPGNSVTIHNEAGLVTVHNDQYTAVCSMKNSGAWQAHWLNPNQSVFDPPIAVVQASGQLRTTCNEHVTIASSEKDRFEVVGYFRGSNGKKCRHTSLKHKFRRDGFRRVITFTDDEIRVVDEVWVALSCQALLLQFASTDAVANSLGSAHLLPKTPLIINGGRSVAVERVYKACKLIKIHRQETSSNEIA